MVHAIEVHASGGVKVFRPTGVTGEWELELVGARGPEPGGYWQSEDVARALVEDVYEA
jgi:hypothetical protein